LPAPTFICLSIIRGSLSQSTASLFPPFPFSNLLRPPSSITAKLLDSQARRIYFFFFPHSATNCPRCQSVVFHDPYAVISSEIVHYRTALKSSSCPLNFLSEVQSVAVDKSLDIYKVIVGWVATIACAAGSPKDPTPVVLFQPCIGKGCDWALSIAMTPRDAVLSSLKLSLAIANNCLD
jgi:hypothetical protein